MSSQPFKISDIVIYPAQGVGIIEKIESQNMCGSTVVFLFIRIFSTNATLMVPVDSSERVGLRFPCSKDFALQVLNYLNTPISIQIRTGQNWNRRFRDYSDKIQSKDLMHVAYVLKELLALSRVKELSFGEKRILEHSMQLVCGEISQVLGQSFDDTKNSLLQLDSCPKD